MPDGSGDDGGGVVLSWDMILSLAPSNVRPFLTSPGKEIISVVFGAVVGGVIGIAELLSGAVLFVFYGNESGTKGISDVPGTIGSMLATFITTPVSVVGGVIGSLNTIILETSSAAGPLELPVALVLYALLAGTIWTTFAFLINLGLGFFGFDGLESPLGPLSVLLRYVR